MKKFFITLAVTMQAVNLLAPPAAIVLTISPLGNGYSQIIAPGNTIIGGGAAHCILQTSSDLVTWTSISTNTFPETGHGYGVTNLVHMTNSKAFYRVEAYGGPYGPH